MCPFSAIDSVLLLFIPLPAMRSTIIRFLPLLVAVALCGCDSVTSKTIVGDKVPALDPKVWNGKWRNADGSAIATRIVDAKAGIIELKRFQPWTKPTPGELQADNIWVRTLGQEVIANELQSGGVGYEFQRVAISADYIVTYSPDEKVFAGLIKRGEIAGKLERDKDGKPTGSCTIEGFSGRDYERLEREGFNVQSLFDEDPAQVYIRGHGLW